MRHLYTATILAALISVGCWQPRHLQAGTPASDLVERLNPINYWRFDDDDDAHVFFDESEGYVGLAPGGAALATPGVIQSESDGCQSLPLPTVHDPAPVEPPSPVIPRSAAPAVPFVHRCPLCDVYYSEVPIYRVQLPGTSTLPSLPYCDTFRP